MATRHICSCKEKLIENSIETYMTIPEIMEKLQISRSTVYRFVLKNKLRPANIGRSKRFKTSDINKALS